MAHRRAALTGGLLACAAAVALFLPSTSRAEIYWANGTSSATTIGRATNEGGGINPSFISGYKNPSGVAVSPNGTHVYWSAGGPNTAPPNPADPAAIGRAGIDGGMATQDWIENDDCEDPAFQHLSQPYNLAIDATHLYWVDWASSNIGRATLDRSGPNNGVDCDWFDLNPYSPGYVANFGIAVDDQYVYWTKAGNASTVPAVAGGIGRVAKDGSNPIPDFIGGTPAVDLGNVRAVAVNAGFVYWLDSKTGAERIGRSNADGTGVDRDFVTSIDGSDGLAVDDEFIYWTYYAPSPLGAIGRVGLDGSTPEQSFISSLSYPKGVFVTNAVGAMTPTSSDFGEQVVGSGSPSTRTFTLSSSGTAPLTIDADGITKTGNNPGDFPVTGGTCQAGTTSLVAGQSCTVVVAFDPTSTGAKSATLQVATNDGSFTAGLSGIGTPAPDPGPDPGPTPEPSITALKLTSKVKRVKAPRKGRKAVQMRVRVTNSGDAAGSATVNLSSSSRKVGVPRQVRVPVGPKTSASRSFKVTIRPGAPRKAKITARSGGGGGGKATFSEITITITKPPKK